MVGLICPWRQSLLDVSRLLSHLHVLMKSIVIVSATVVVSSVCSRSDEHLAYLVCVCVCVCVCTCPRTCIFKSSQDIRKVPKELQASP